MMVPSQPKQTVYNDFKKATEPTRNSQGKKLISKAGRINDGPCPLSTEGYCNVARDQDREFYCGSNWWKSCTVYLEKMNCKEVS